MPFLTDMYHENNKERSAAGSPLATPAEPKGALANGHSNFQPEEFAARLRERIVGQDDAIKAVTRAVTLVRAGMCETDRPLANILLAGPTGVGKTELVRSVAAQLRSGPDDLCRIDMSALAQEHYAASFSGAPPGYAGSKESFSLFEKGVIEGDPYTPGIVLFDEIEKADRTVLRALLHILDNGELRLANGQRTISFRNSYVFMTSNLGSRSLLRLQHSLRARMRPSWLASARSPGRIVRRELERFFDPEFFNRLDETVMLNAFTDETATAVTRLELDLLRRRLTRRSVTLTVTDEAIAQLTVTTFDRAYGARGLRRAIRQHVSEPLARELIRVRPSGNAPVNAQVTAAGRELRVEVR